MTGLIAFLGLIFFGIALASIPMLSEVILQKVFKVEFEESKDEEEDDDCIYYWEI